MKDNFVDNVNEVEPTERPTGNTRQRAIRKLRKDAPELHERVLAGELSPHRAMVQAGFRKEKTALELTQAAYSKLTADEREAFLAWVS